MRTLIVMVVLGLVMLGGMTHASEDAKAPDATVLGDQVAALKATVHRLETQLQIVSNDNETCQATSADWRAKFMSVNLTQNGQRLQKERAALKDEWMSRLKGDPETQDVNFGTDPPTLVVKASPK